MGITKLADLIRFDAPDAISYKDISDYTGKAIALDTSIVVNQFRAATPSLNKQIQDKYTLLSSPLTGLFFRTLTFLEYDIKPVFVFDGRPPGEKRAVLEKRAELAGWTSPSHTGTELYLKESKLNARNCIQLLKLIGVPVIQAPADAEALCAWLVKEGTVDAVASEDMDTLPFGANILIRQFKSKKDGLIPLDREVIEYSLTKLLERLQINHQEFVDLCILLGCDYCEKICGLGPRRALRLIQKHRTIENVLLHINRKNHSVPLSWKYNEARKIFLDAPQAAPAELTWTEPDEEALVEFLCRTTRVSEARVRQRLLKFHQIRETGRQTRMENFFRITIQPGEAGDSLSSSEKRPKPK
uniref:Zgc:110269 n=1 Tax=Tetraodon nigroviridis TaxID=99883 RepID=H3CQY2_TETNG